MTKQQRVRTIVQPKVSRLPRAETWANVSQNLTLVLGLEFGL